MTETKERPKGSRLRSLTGVRFPALLLVFLNHIHLGIPLRSPEAGETYYTWAGWIGQAGLSLFFLISGFLLVWTAREHDSALQFWRRRFVRIAPLHWVTFGLSLAIFAYPAVSGTAAVLNFLMVSSWSTDPEIFGSMNAPSWSLTCLALFYLLFPALHRAVRRVPARRLWWCAGAVVAAIISITVVVRAVVPADPMIHPLSPASSLDAFYFIQIFPVSRVLEFLLGILLARLVISGRWIGAARPLPATALLLAGFFVAYQLPREYRLVAAMIIPVALFAGSLAAADIAGRKSLLATRPMQWLGDISFAFFLVHWPVIMFFAKVFGQQRMYSVSEFIAVALLDLTVSIILAWLLTIGVERPLVQLLSGPRGRTEQPPTDPLPSVPSPRQGGHDEEVASQTHIS
ncbi:acyltransferase [Streptomyces sp. PTY087I2]|uniref:acyltransferase family protein n=1 Tax=Streptomyces sp. PTY087I2 TaxID=1819298 RepID=UPI00080B772C|nr:acyltransferase [Streptomyces sp. PTY087I2]OCC07230.1 glucans biosynthesis protein [Streptomyces sp. PTY087I2]